jgi:hypothetical protein
MHIIKLTFCNDVLKHHVSVLTREYAFPSGLFHSRVRGYLSTLNIFGGLISYLELNTLTQLAVKIHLNNMVYSRIIFIKSLESGQRAWVGLTRVAKCMRIDHCPSTIGEDGVLAQVATSLYVATVIT